MDEGWKNGQFTISEIITCYKNSKYQDSSSDEEIHII